MFIGIVRYLDKCGDFYFILYINVYYKVGSFLRYEWGSRNRKNLEVGRKGYKFLKFYRYVRGLMLKFLWDKIY